MASDLALKQALDLMLDRARAEYDGLPEAIKGYYSYEQYLWLSDGEKASLIQTETEPDHYDD